MEIEGGSSLPTGFLVGFFQSGNGSQGYENWLQVWAFIFLFEVKKGLHAEVKGVLYFKLCCHAVCSSVFLATPKGGLQETRRGTVGQGL